MILQLFPSIDSTPNLRSPFWIRCNCRAKTNQDRCTLKLAVKQQASWHARTHAWGGIMSTYQERFTRGSTAESNQQGGRRREEASSPSPPPTSTAGADQPVTTSPLVQQRNPLRSSEPSIEYSGCLLCTVPLDKLMKRHSEHELSIFSGQRFRHHEPTDQ